MKTTKPVLAFGSGLIAVAAFFLFPSGTLPAVVTAGGPESPPESRT